MNKEKINVLLEEAVLADQYRQREILTELLDSINRKVRERKNKVCSNCLKKILTSVYWYSLRNEPENLMNLLPLFIILCGYSENTDSSCVMSII